MDELVKLVSEKVGISEKQAREAVELVVDTLKKQLPEPLAGQIDAVLKGDLGDLGDIVGSLGGMFGK
jgi:hypothetical protein